VRLWVAAWLLFQVASLSALVPKDCCAAHHAAAPTKQHSCHEDAGAPDSAMETGAHCPMHHNGGNGEEPASGCTMRGTCSGPMAALMSFLSNTGVLTDSFKLTPTLHAGFAPDPLREHLTSRLASPDPPPPRVWFLHL